MKQVVEKIKQALTKKGNASEQNAKDAIQISKNWFSDRYEWLEVQRNILFVLLLSSAAIIVFLTLTISYIKSTRTIEPFVIEIEPKTGVTTVVQPEGTKIYAEEESVRRYFIWKYIKAREEYYRSRYDLMAKEVSVLSSPQVYGEYASIYGKNNPQSPYNILGDGSYRYVELKSMLMLDEKNVQVRIKMKNGGGSAEEMNKVIYMTYLIENTEMNMDQRFINPINFKVTNYRIEDEIIG
jgi:type IV secretion system protein VirB8